VYGPHEFERISRRGGGLGKPVELNFWEEMEMTWSTPKVVEIVVGMEINCYVCAEL